MDRIILGTAQFGMDYGVNNAAGRVPREEVFNILDKASACGIDTLDTAYAYGESEQALGDCLKKLTKKFRVISKFPECRAEELEGIFNESCRRIGVSSLYGYLVHSFRSFEQEPEIWDALRRLKAQKKVEKIGFSLYHPSEFDSIIERGLKPDIIQFPFSVFDRRFALSLSRMKEHNIESHGRSVFLQGLVFKDPGRLEGCFKGAGNKLKQLRELSLKTEIPVFALCLGFVLVNEHIDKAVVGVDSLQNLNEIAECDRFISQVKQFKGELETLGIDNEDIILPFNWKKERARAR